MPARRSWPQPCGLRIGVWQIGDAEVELRKANDYQKKSKTMLCIYLLLLLCGLMVIVLLLKKSLSSR